jgi:uncharacterized protein (DUF2141 family)
LSVGTALLVLASVSAPAGQGGRGGGQGQGPGAAGRGGAPRDSALPGAVGTGAISGSVTVEGSGTPVRRARVTLTGQELRGGRSVITDDNGRFAFQALPAGRYTMTASKAGFVDLTFGARRPGRQGTPIQLAEGQHIERANIALPRGSVLTGVVVDEHGEPAAGTQVRALRYVMRTGEKTLQQVGQDTADDRGIYRIYQLQPGEYVVNALPRNMTAGDTRQALAAEVDALVRQAQAGRGGAGPDLAGLAGLAAGRGAALGDRLAQLQQQLAQTDATPVSAYAPVYYPGTTSPSGAATVTLGVGEERGGIDFQLQLVATARVQGSISTADGQMQQNTQVALVPADRGGLPAAPGLGTNMTRVGANGEFVFNNVTPGEYVVQARSVVREQPAGNAAPAAGGGRGGRGAPGVIQQVLWASAPVGVNGQDVTGLTLSLQPGMTLAGRVEFRGAAAPVTMSNVRVSLQSRGSQALEIGPTPPAQVDDSGRFTITGVVPGRYTLSGAAGGNAGRGARGGGPAGGGPAAGPSGSWTLASAVVAGRDVLDFPIDIGPNEDINGALLTFTDRTQELSGTIQDTTGRPTSEFTIVVFPSDNRYWLPQSRRILSTRPGTDGRFTVRGLPPGEYRLTAVTDVETGEWYDPAFLAQLQQVSIPISIAEGDRKVQDIRLAGN